MNRLSDEAASAAADAVCNKLNGGVICIYDNEVVLVELQYPPQAYSPAIEGVAIANEIAPSIAIGTGTANLARHLQPDGRMVFEGSVGTSGESLNLDRVEIVAGTPVMITSQTYSQLK